MCDESLVRPLSIIFRNSLNSCIYPNTWKKANVISIHKKDGKQCGNMFEKLICNEINSFLDREKLPNTNQSGIRPFDSCLIQLLTITHEIFSSFDCKPSLEFARYFWTSQKFLIKSGLKVCLIN